ncbi:hypothetical protein SAMN04488563_6394 [Jiangella alkaliphila]|uniref:WXG100 family type VII secretion target n=1 Tax=Jiangella alkaliphila TaxID=419479 RepID=A0A1H2LM84_9ACTN|nr:hypothetical protein SAMN04488563_6394 [Jiangella alkaliphila]
MPGSSLDTVNDSTRRADLEQLQIRVSRIVDDLKGALDTPLTIMAGGGAWTGTRADAFGADLDGHKAALQTAADTIAGDIAAEVASAPEDPPA